jgi:hypothetical protein
LVGYSESVSLFVTANAVWADTGSFASNPLPTVFDFIIEVRHETTGSNNYNFGVASAATYPKATGNFREIEFGIQINNNDYFIRELSTITALGIPFSQGDKFRFTSDGTTITLKLNGTTIATKTADQVYCIGVGHNVAVTDETVRISNIDGLDVYTVGAKLEARYAIWPRDESDPTLDVLGNPLQYTGSVPKYATPVDAPCLTFNGTTQRIRSSKVTGTGISKLSVSARVKSGDGQVANEWYYADNKRSWLILVSSSTGYVIAQVSGNGSNRKNYTVETNVNDGVWHKIGFDFDSGEFKLFIDDVEQAVVKTQDDAFTTIFDDTPYITIGALPTNDTAFETYFGGEICDLQIRKNDDLVFWMPMSEGDGNTVYDVANGDSYTITGYASTMWDITQSEFFYNVRYGGNDNCQNFARLSGGIVKYGTAIGTITDGQISPLGNNDAYLISLDSQTGGGNWCEFAVPATFPGSEYAHAWVKAATADDVGKQVSITIASGSAVLFELPVDWTQVSTTLQTYTGNSSFSIRNRPGTHGQPNVNQSCSFYVWRMHSHDSADPNGRNYILGPMDGPNSIQDPIFAPALIDGTSSADPNNAITGLPGLLNSDTYALNLLPEPDAPYQRSAIPGATFDGVGDSVSVNNVDWDFTEDFEYEITAYLPAPTNQFLIGSATGFTLGIVLTPFTSESGLSFQCGGTTANVNKFDVLGAIYAIDSVNVIKFEFESATGNVKATVNGTEYTGNLSNPAGSSQIALGIRRQSDNSSPFAGRIDRFHYSSATTSVEYDFRENNGLIIPDRSGNGNDGTLVVNSSLDQIFAPTALETAYTLGDGRTRPHYVTEDNPNEKDFRTEII